MNRQLPTFLHSSTYRHCLRRGSTVKGKRKCIEVQVIPTEAVCELSLLAWFS